MKNKLKVIGFGIGTSCKDYLKNFSDEYDIIALSDWDKETHGTSKYGYKVIDPYEFDNYDYDKILILSYYVKEIKQQLLEKLNIDSDKLIVPEKHKIKGRVLPFEDEKTKEFARTCLVYFSEITRKNDIIGFLDYGALLGIVRDGDIITWDDDIDFTIFAQDSKKLERLLLDQKSNFPESENLNWTCKLNKDQEGNIWYFSLEFTNKLKNKYREFEVAFSVRDFYKGHAIKMRNDYQSAPEMYFKKHEFIQYNNAEILVPYKHIEYLDFYYKNWQQPEKLTFGVEYGISYTGSLEEIKLKTKEEILF